MPTRKNVWELGGDWAEPLLWYARAVKIMKARPIADATSWRFYAAIHGLDAELWQRLGYLGAGDNPPSVAVTRSFWNQCQHGSWYFLPWHRGYLLAFEAVVRAAVVSAKGPSDWALPYWNYFKAGQNVLPPAFASPDWPDGTGDNPLYVPQRYGPNNDGSVFVPLDAVNENAMNDPDFTGVDSGGSPGFGGVDTGFAHGGQVHGALETQPHDWVHGLVGGGDPNAPPEAPLPGLMSDPDTAGLDPIFWLHHANIDRLWEVWRRSTLDTPHTNPTEARWLQGPASTGERAFAMPMADGSTWTYRPADVVDLATLGYGYDDLSAAAPASLEPIGARPMASSKTTELVGATPDEVPIQGTEAHAVVRLHPVVRKKVVATLDAAAPTPRDRVFLNLENVRGNLDSAAFHVYVGIPRGARPEDSPRMKAGSIALFGVRKASKQDGEHGGQGLTFVLEITNIVDELHQRGAFDVDSIDVRLVPVKAIPAEAQVNVGRISVVRQGAP